MKKFAFTLAEVGFSVGCSDSETRNFAGFVEGGKISQRNLKPVQERNSRIIRYKWAFTLAEVLITLGIIGIVAAITIPSLITSYQKKQTVTRLKRAYSVVQQAIKLSEIDNGEVSSWNTSLSGEQFFQTYLANYVKYMNKYTSQELWNLAPRKYLNGTAYGGTTYNSGSLTTAHFTLLDGSIISTNLDNAKMWVGIDINGLAKPNTVGKDTFIFIFTSKYGLRPLGDAGSVGGWSYGAYLRTNVGPQGTGGNACRTGGLGYWCASLIMHDGWNIAPDYPWNAK